MLYQKIQKPENSKIPTTGALHTLYKSQCCIVFWKLGKELPTFFLLKYEKNYFNTTCVWLN